MRSRSSRRSGTSASTHDVARETPCGRSSRARRISGRCFRRTAPALRAARPRARRPDVGGHLAADSLGLDLARQVEEHPIGHLRERRTQPGAGRELGDQHGRLTVLATSQNFAEQSTNRRTRTLSWRLERTFLFLTGPRTAERSPPSAEPALRVESCTSTPLAEAAAASIPQSSRPSLPARLGCAHGTSPRERCRYHRGMLQPIRQVHV
jgi:hypothetical protein